MIKLHRITEIIDDDIKEIRAITNTNEYISIRLQNKWLDVRATKIEGESMRTIYRDKIDKDMDIAEIIKYLNIIFEWGW